MSDDEVAYLPAIEIDLDNPLLPMLAIQFDFRERFLHAIEDVSKLDTQFDGMGASVEEWRQHYAIVMAVLQEAVDPEAISEWMDKNRPMPWLDNELRDEIRLVVERAQELLVLMSSTPTS